MNARRLVESWNASQPVGSPVTWKRGGTIVVTKTRSIAELRADGRAVVAVDGLTEAIELEKVSPLSFPGIDLTKLRSGNHAMLGIF